MSINNFKQIESFIAAASLGSLSAAARQEGVLPAVIAARIDELEARINARLLVRTTRGVRPTEAGRSFLEACSRVLGDIEAAETRIAVQGRSVTGQLRITAPTGFGRRHIAPLLPQLTREHPNLTVMLDLSDQLESLASSQFDCAIHIGELPDSTLVSVRLADTRRMVVSAPAYLERFGQPRHPRDLVNFNCLCFDSRGRDWDKWHFVEDGKPLKIKVQGNLKCTDGGVVYDWVLRGLGLAWRPHWEVERDVRDGRLVPVLEAYAAPPQGIFAVIPQLRQIPPRVSALVDLLRRTYQESGYPESVPASTGR